MIIVTVVSKSKLVTENAREILPLIRSINTLSMQSKELVCLYCATIEPKCEVQCKGWLNRTDGCQPPGKATSTGTMTRIVAMEQSKASKIFFMHTLTGAYFFTLFTVHAVTVRFIIVLLILNVRISFEKHIIGVHVKFSLVTLTICKSHFFLTLLMHYRVIVGHAFLH